MKNFFNNHPIFATCLTSCLMLLIFTSILIGGFVFLIAKTIPEDELTQSQEYTYKYLDGDKESTNKILSIPVYGIILTNVDYSDPFGAFLATQSIGYQIKGQLYKAAEDPDIKGVILEIDSPGGTITGAKAISDGVDYFRQKTNKPVIAHVQGLGASGGYWTAASADKVYADTGTLVGSIGVIMGPFKQYTGVVSEANFSSSVTAAQIDSFNLTSGEDKDFGDPYKEISQEAQDKMQENINNEYQVFVDYIESRRSIDETKIKEDIGARVYGTKQAAELGLIDSEGTYQQALGDLLTTAQINDTNFQVVTTGQKGFWEEVFSVFYKEKPVMAKSTCALCGKMLFLYGAPTEYSMLK